MNTPKRIEIKVDTKRCLDTDQEKITDLERRGYRCVKSEDTRRINPLTYDYIANLTYEKTVYTAVYSSKDGAEDILIPVSEPEIHLYREAGVPFVTA